MRRRKKTRGPVIAQQEKRLPSARSHGARFASMHDTAIFRLREEFLDAFVADRMAQGGRNFRKRHQNKPPLAHSWMGNFELLGADDARSVEQHIEIDNARAPADRMFAAKFVFDFLEGSEQLARH